MALNRYQSGSPSYLPNAEADLGIDNYDYLQILRQLRTNAGMIYANVELDKKANRDEVNRRIDLIITTPVDSVSAQEIIDARDGEVSLGEKIRSVNAQLEKVN